MTKNYYAVTVKFGHVGKTKCIIKTVPTVAEDGKKAAEAARWMARAKHHAKDVIVSVIKINEDQYLLLKKEHDKDPYFHCKNVQQQRTECIGIYDNVQSMVHDIDTDKRKYDRKMRVNFKQKKYRAQVNAYRFSKNDLYESYAY